MDLNMWVRFVVMGLLCFLTSCTKDNASPACDNGIVLAGVKGALYRDIGQGGDQYTFTKALGFKEIETVKVTEEGRECTAKLTIKKIYYMPINYEVAVENTEYYVTFSGLNDGSKDNIYKIVNNQQPNLTSE